MATATWKGVVIAKTDKFETIEGNVRTRCLVDAGPRTGEQGRGWWALVREGGARGEGKGRTAVYCSGG